MDSNFKLVPIALLLCFSASNIATARMLDSRSALPARLKLEEVEGSSNCWESLFELQSCTAEVVLFFLNGETYLGPGCCQAIRIIQHDCWPTMLGSLGYTTEEGDILRGYCDASSAVPPPPSPPQAHWTATVLCFVNRTKPLSPLSAIKSIFCISVWFDFHYYQNEQDLYTYISHFALFGEIEGTCIARCYIRVLHQI